MEPTVTGMAALLQTVTQAVTAAVSWVGSFIGVVTAEGNEFLLLALILPFVGFGVGILRRLISLN